MLYRIGNSGTRGVHSGYSGRSRVSSNSAAPVVGYGYLGRTFKGHSSGGGSWTHHFGKLNTPTYSSGGARSTPTTNNNSTADNTPTPTTPTGNTTPGDNDNNNAMGGGPYAPGGERIPKTRESAARRRSQNRGRRAQGTRRSLRIGKSLGGMTSRSGVNV